MAIATERQSDALRKRQQRAAAQLVRIPYDVDRSRVLELEDDPAAWLMAFFPDKFYHPFTSCHEAMIEAVLHTAQHGGDQSVAAPRGSGKSTLVQCLLIYSIFTAMVRFPMLIAATGRGASRMLADIKYELETNDLLAEPWAYPLACIPAQDVAGAPQRAKAQECALVDYKTGEQISEQKPSRMVWHADHVIFPDVTDSQYAGTIIAAAGMDSAIRGMIVRGVRPDFALVDDPDTRESAASDIQTGSREELVEKDIAGLAGRGKKIARVLLCTIQNHRCLAATYTNRTKKPSWNGARYGLIEKWPDSQQKWDEYVLLRQSGKESNEDPNGEKATAFYLDNQEEMDKGAIITDDHRFIPPLEHSTLQHCFNVIADRGIDAFQTEYQNDPPQETKPEESGITATAVRKQIDGRERGICSPLTERVTAAIDIGKRVIHYEIAGWRGEFIGEVIDYGVFDVHGAVNDAGLEPAIGNALQRFRDQFIEQAAIDENGEPRKLDICLIDAGNWDTTIYNFVASAGRPFYPSKGVGGGQRGASGFHAGKPSKTRRVGAHWYSALQSNGHWLFHLDADHWKEFRHSRWMTPALDEKGQRRKGSLTLFGNDPQEHFAYSQHQTAEILVTEFVEGKGEKTWWKRISRNNHWLDCGYMNCAAASMVNVKFKPAALPKQLPQPKTQRRRRTAPRRSWLNSHKGKW